MNWKSLLFRSACCALFVFALSFMSGQVHAQVHPQPSLVELLTAKVPNFRVLLLLQFIPHQVAVMVPLLTKKVFTRFRVFAVGGPYTVTVSFVGFKDQVTENVSADLGTSADVNFKLADEGTALQEVVITTGRSDVFSSDRNGASTSFDRNAINSTPTIGRSINDITKYNPYGTDNHLPVRMPVSNNHHD